jgi:hypothetical protein
MKPTKAGKQGAHGPKKARGPGEANSTGSEQSITAHSAELEKQAAATRETLRVRQTYQTTGTQEAQAGEAETMWDGPAVRALSSSAAEGALVKAIVEQSQPGKPVAEISKAPSPISPLKGIGPNFRVWKSTMTTPNWREWEHTPEVRVWQACALSLNIEPNSMTRSRNGWMRAPGNGPFFEDESFPSDAVKAEFGLRQRVLLANLSKRELFSPGILSTNTPGNCGVRLPEFAAWASAVVKWGDLPPELVLIGKDAGQPTAKGAASVDAARVNEPQTKERTAPKLNLPDKRDDWVAAIEATYEIIVQETGTTPGDKEVWLRMNSNPPINYPITKTLDRGLAAITMAGAKPITREAFVRRWKRYAAAK